MSKIISIHEYVLKPEVDPQQFEQAILQAKQSGVLELPGLETVYFLRGIRGARKGCYAALWIYESREAWEKIWGPPEQPPPPEEYPPNWRIWEEKILKPFLDRDPDTITYTAYETG